MIFILKLIIIIGNEQTDLTGRRLSELTKKIKFTKLTNSSMIRAIQSANNIVRHLPEDLPRFEDPLLCEGAPIPPEPPVGHWKPELFVRKPYFLKTKIISF